MKPAAGLKANQMNESNQWNKSILKMGSFFIKKKRVKNIEERNYGRKTFTQILPTAQCQTWDGDFRAAVCNISSSGAFIKTSRRFFVGQEIAMKITFPATMETRMVTGEIARTTPLGAGVKFKVFFK
jgi:hypothetical protein